MASINGTATNDLLRGSDDDDVIVGLAGADRLFGLGGNDILAGGAGTDFIDGGDGSDTASYADAAAGVQVNLSITMAQNTLGAGNDTLVAVENLVGSDFADRLAGDGGTNDLDGGAGIDTLTYAGAATGAGVTVDLSRTDAQNTGGAGIDTIRNFENLTGSGFDDWLAGTIGNNVIAGGAGNDTISYATATAGVSVNLAVTTQQDTLGAGRDTVFGFENLVGSSFNDRLSGTDGANVLDGGAGRDTISYGAASAAVNVSLALQNSAQDTGGAGIDRLRNFENLTGSAFADVLAGDAGDNIIAGGLGVDTVSYTGAASGVRIDLAVTSAQQTIGAGTDTLFGIENLIGSAFDDELLDTFADNAIFGGDGNDRITTSAGSDTADGGTGYDEWEGDYRLQTAALAGIFDGEANAFIVSNGTTVRNFENIELVSGSGGDAFTIAVAAAGFSPGRVFISGADGVDAITIDLRKVVAAGTIDFEFSSTPGFDSAIIVGAGETSFRSFEQIAVTLSDSDDTLAGSLEFATGSTTTLRIDAGAGNDRLIADFRNAPVTFIAGADGTADVTGNRLANFESFDLSFAAQSNFVVSGGGDDNFTFAAGLSFVDGGGGDDVLKLLVDGLSVVVVADGNGGGEIIDNNPSDGVFGTLKFQNIEQLVFLDFTPGAFVRQGTQFDDSLAGTSLIDRLVGLGGNDMLRGFGNDDVLEGGTGIDTAVFAGNRADYDITTIDATTATITDSRASRDGTDTLQDIEFLRFADRTVALRALAFVSPTNFTVAENTLVIGSVVATSPDPASLRYAITGGVDAAQFTIDAISGALSFARTSNFELPRDAERDNIYDLVVTASDGIATAQALQVTVTDVAEVPTQIYTGTSAANVFTAIDGEGWTLSGLGGADRLTGGDHADVLIGGKGNDILTGSEGDDIFRIAAGDGIDTIMGGAGFDSILATTANTAIGASALSGIEVIDANGQAGVRLVGAAAADVFDLSATLLVGIGTISGLGGNDTIIGSGGADRIVGGAGADQLTGGAGADVFVYTLVGESGVGVGKADQIFDFTSGEDRIDLNAIDANAGIAGNQDFEFVGGEALTGLGQIWIGIGSGGQLAIFGNISGSLSPDFQITIVNGSILLPTDLLL